MSSSAKSAGIVIILLLVAAVVVMTRTPGGGQQQPPSGNAGPGGSVGQEVLRITAQEVKSKMDSGASLLLVCAYEDGRFRQAQLKGAMSLQDLKSRLPSLPRDTEIVTY